MLITLTSSLPDLSAFGKQISNAITIVSTFIQSGNEPTNIITETISPAIQQFTETFSIFLTILILILGLIGCFFGFKLSRLFMTISGFFVGLFLGSLVGIRFLHANNGIILLCILVGGLLISFFAYRIYQGGIFLFSFCLTFVGIANFMPLTGNLAFFLCTLGGFLVGVLALKFVRPVMILSSSIVCAHIASGALVQVGSKMDTSFFTQPYANLLIFAILFIAGTLVQFLTNPESTKKPKSRRRK